MKADPKTVLKTLQWKYFLIFIIVINNLTAEMQTV